MPKESAINVWLSESESYTALVEDIRNKVEKLAPANGWAYPEEVFDDFVIYRVGAPSVETAYFKAPYSKNADGVISLGTAVKVKKVTSYPPHTDASNVAGAGTGDTLEATGDPSQGTESFVEEGVLLEVDDA